MSEPKPNLQDPACVWANLLRGTIAWPPGLVDIGAVQAAVEAEDDTADQTVRQAKDNILKRIAEIQGSQKGRP